ncbi:alpha/beta hydrolase [Mucisphaera calidilacus]|uniref:Acetylxylan esterase n=1 Tax=Mucisphaera calidilacus TaxID=2527982 RepID=A0A518BX87_9BACT|nr:alpha/beta hydrolase [Mucisphaera calidilacus]QDU71589.1 Acetylxylan esterase precursor [Mucisphaera calidilacus]
MPNQTLPIWPAIPEGLPNLTLVDPQPDANRPAVVICPGGGYRDHADHEAEPVARKLIDAGFAAAVLRYRVSPSRHPDPLNDLQRAIRMMRHNARTWGVDPARVAALGFSAGGHLCSSAAVFGDQMSADHDDLRQQHSGRPDAVILGYPVIDMHSSIRHNGSAANLLGPDPDEATLQKMSTQLRVSPETCPAFLWHTVDDASVPVDNSIQFANACIEHKVPVELHLYPEGPHGLGLATGAGGRPPIPEAQNWIDLAIAFLRRWLCSTS